MCAIAAAVRLLTLCARPPMSNHTVAMQSDKSSLLVTSTHLPTMHSTQFVDWSLTATSTGSPSARSMQLDDRLRMQ